MFGSILIIIDKHADSTCSTGRCCCFGKFSGTERKQVWPSSGWKAINYNDFTGISHDISIPVAANDYIYFIVNKKGSITADATVWDPTIRYTGL
ncbi:hypothetical protein EHS13_01045 [Paenibacillus psychroresistens]|uniref:Uncharacterized protein n=1 Tax=Paenibacillus psychroresistens TaxID=1778678 RepID=A0A6B8RDR7_9BACL|nr:hypothetical protein [Paenibacillus psychroresistens]QGQ93602.1 hypothetical protein EHS13_01045 [Paenibacillus psychroresistens]